MKISNTLKQENKAAMIWISICTFYRLLIFGFIRQNALVFTNLARSSTPFGGSIRAREY